MKAYSLIVRYGLVILFKQGDCSPFMLLLSDTLAQFFGESKKFRATLHLNCRGSPLGGGIDFTSLDARLRDLRVQVVFAHHNCGNIPA